MNAQLQVFQFEDHTIRVVTWGDYVKFIRFAAIDVATLLGYVQPREAVRFYCKYPIVLSELKKKYYTVTFDNVLNELHPCTLIIKEEELYRLVASSSFPLVERFERWVKEELIPSSLGPLTPFLSIEEDLTQIGSFNTLFYVGMMLFALFQ